MPIKTAAVDTPTPDPCRRLVDSLPSMMAYWGSDLRCRFANLAYERWFGVHPSGLIGKSLQELLGPELFSLNEPYVRAVLAGHPQTFERIVPGPRKEARYSLAHYVPDRQDGAVVGFFVQVTEVTSLHEARAEARAEALRTAQALDLVQRSEGDLRQAQRLAQVGSWSWELDGDVVQWSDQVYAIFGTDVSRLPPDFAGHAALYTPRSWSRLQAAVERALATGEPYVLDLEYVRMNGSTGWLEARGEVRFDEQGCITGLFGTAQEISVRHKLENAPAAQRPLKEALQELQLQAARSRELERMVSQIRSDARFRTVFQSMFNFIGLLTLEGELIEANEAALQFGGLTAAEVLGRKFWETSWWEVGEEAKTKLKDSIAVAAAGAFVRYEADVKVANGHRATIDFSLKPVRDSAGSVVELIAEGRDLTELKQAERRQAFLLCLSDRAHALHEPLAVINTAAQKLAQFLKAAHAGYGEVDETGEFLAVCSEWSDGRIGAIGDSPRMADFGQAMVASLDAGETVNIADVAVDPRIDSPGAIATYARRGVRSALHVPLLKAGRMVALLFVHHHEARAWIPSEQALVEEVAGRIWRIVQQARAESALASSEDRLRTILHSLPQIVWSTRPDGCHDFYNRRWYEFTGLPEASTDGTAWNSMLHPDDQAPALQRWRDSLETGEPYEIEYRLRHHSGGYRWVLGRAIAERDVDGAIVRWMGTCTDLQVMIQTRGALSVAKEELERLVAERTAELEQSRDLLVQEMRLRGQAQGALLQAQKLEALGQLTGSVAHDFNNMLAAIQGSFKLLQKRVQDGTGQRLLRSGVKASERAAALIRQLLAFARREELQTSALDPATLIEEVSELLRQAAGRGTEVVIEPVAPGTWPVLADRHQLEVALMNLAVNARDAMPDGGKLTLSIRNCLTHERALLSETPLRDCVLFQVTDTGIGMSPETQMHAMEPFFTTKRVGLGTGLGLTMVHGMAQQLGGTLLIESELGRGTAMTIVLPRSEQAADVLSAEDAPIDPELHGGATLLVVDDDDQVRIVTASFLRDLNYSVIEVSSKQAALAALGVSDQVDLVVTDVLMPQASGLLLAADLRALRPALPILFITGFATDARLTGEVVLPKPLRFGDLAHQIALKLGRIHTA